MLNKHKLKVSGIIAMMLALIFVIAACDADFNDDLSVQTISIEGNEYEVPYGTAENYVIDYYLPAKADLTLSNDTIETEVISSWDAENYNQEEPGEYVFTASLLFQGSTLNSDVNVTVLAELDDDFEITSIGIEGEEFRVRQGRTEEEVISRLPLTTEVTVADGSTSSFMIDWEADNSYDQTNPATYQFIANLIYNNETVASLDIDLTVLNTETIAGDINEDTTFEPDNLYMVDGNIDINANLTIKPGTRIYFKDNSGFKLTEDNWIKAGDIDNSSISALDLNEVTSGDQIIFAAQIPALGWDGIIIDSSNQKNVMDNVIIKDVNDRDSALVIKDGAYLDFTNSIIEDSDE